MSKSREKRRLTKKQRSILSDIFENQLDENEIQQKHNISREKLKEYISDPMFVDELESRVDSSRRQCRIIIARYGPLAAAKLVELTESEKAETARKACLDIIDAVDKQAASAGKAKSKAVLNKDESPRFKMSDSLASKLLAIMASEGGVTNK